MRVNLTLYVNNTGPGQPAHLCSLISAFVIYILVSIMISLASHKNFDILASLSSWAESHFVRKP